MELVPAFSFMNLLQFYWNVFVSGGWFFVLILVIYMLWYIYINEIQEQFVEKQEWVFLRVIGPKENLTSTLAVEQIFHQLHTLYVGLTFAEKYIEGKIQLWYSFEIVSMGGKVSMVLRVPKARKAFVESAIYAEYPNAEVTQVEDYMKDIVYDPDTSDFDIFGTEFKQGDVQYIPIKTYKDFEHTTAENNIIDPLAPVFEGMAKVKPYEFFGIQILAQPTQDEEWQPSADRFVKELTGEEVPHESTWLGLFLKPFELLANFSFKKAVLESHGHEEENRQRNNWMTMTDMEKEKVNLVQKKTMKVGFRCKIRHLYIAPKDKYDPNRRTHFIGAFRAFGASMTNKLKPDVSNTWTKVDYIISPDLEKPYMDWLVKERKKFLFKGFKNRSIHIGLPLFILNAEELATLYHWPLTISTPISPVVEKVESKKVQPPPNLPI